MFRIQATSLPVSEVSFHECRELRGNRAPALCRALLFGNRLDIARLQQALHLLTLRHEALRTRFSRSGAGFRREVSETSDLQLQREDWSALAAEDDSVHARVVELTSHGFDPEDYPLAKVNLLDLTAGKCVLVFSVAQALTDLAGIRVLLRELSEIYLALQEDVEPELPRLEYRLSDFVASHTAWMASEDYRNQLDRLCDNLHRSIRIGGGVENLHMKSGADGAYMRGHDFSPDDSAAIFRVSERERLSPTTILMVLSALASAHALDRQGVFFTSSFSNRHLAGATNLVGHLATTMPVFLDASSGSPANTLLRGMHRELFVAMASYGMIPIQEIGVAVGAAYPPPPAGTAIKFGRISVDVTIRDDFPMFDMPVELYPLRNSPRVSNDFKFVYWVYPGRQVRLWIKGVQGADVDNDSVAADIVGARMLPALQALCT